MAISGVEQILLFFKIIWLRDTSSYVNSNFSDMITSSLQLFSVSMSNGIVKDETLTIA